MVLTPINLDFAQHSRLHFPGNHILTWSIAEIKDHFFPAIAAQPIGLKLRSYSSQSHPSMLLLEPVGFVPQEM